MRSLLIERLDAATTTLGAGRATEGVMIFAVAMVLIVLTTALVLVSPLTRPFRPRAELTGTTGATEERPRSSVVHLLAVVVALWIATRLRRLIRRP